MTSKLEYLKRYSKKRTHKKDSQSKKLKSNFRVLDDDVTLKSTSPAPDEALDPDDAPLVAELRDESVLKWQPLSRRVSDDSGEGFLPRESNTSDPVQFSDLSPPRKSLKKFPQFHGVESRGTRMNDPVKSIEKNDSFIHNIKHVDMNEETVYRSSIKKDSILNEYLKRKNSEFEQWGRGVAQEKFASDKAEDDKYEMSKPLARFADDEDLERMLKACPRDGDPMLQFIKKKEKASTVSFKKGKPRFKGNAIPNRFGIYPGYRWDGVDRSNGFEKAWISKASTKKVIQDESYKWSVEDM